MHLSDNSIQHIRDASITQVVSHFVKLDRNGSGLCPFHNEKSPSFKATEAKGIFKCFGCGAAGDAIKFVMDHERLDFLTAVVRVAEIVGIELEYEEPADPEKYKQQKAFKDQMKEVLQFAITDYRQQLWDLPETDPVRQYIRDRKLTRNEVAEWQLGWATTDWKHLTSRIINNGWFEPANKLGIVKRAKDGESNFDGYRSRLIVPIANQHGEYIGIAGRYLQVDPADNGKDFGKAKYINPPENDIYSKSTVLFGLSKAIKAIKEEKFAFLVEGYFDVISMHKNGDQNTVAPCGTGLSPQQAALLKRFTNHVILLRDGDSAGIKAAQRDLPILLKAGFKVDLIQLPEDEDPDSYIRKLNSYDFPPIKHAQAEDAIMWQVKRWVHDAAGDNYQLGIVKENVLQLISSIHNQMIQSNYLDTLCTTYKWSKIDLKKSLANLMKGDDDEVDEDQMLKLPAWMNREEFLENGYCKVESGPNTGYWTASNNGKVRISNFIITPLFHIYAGKESRHMIEIYNGRKRAVLDIESNALVSIELLQKYTVAEGSFIFYGQKLQMLNIATTLLNNFPLCYEVKFLGWQPEGFFAFVDQIYVPGKGLVSLDQWGILHFNDKNYLVPAASAAYKELQRSGDDPYEQDRVLRILDAPVALERWAQMMHRVYLDKGPVAIAYIFLTIFRDIIFNIDNNCPHLYGFGERSAGKSKWAESIAAFFFKGRSAYNLNSGTDFAFFSYMQRFRNCPAVLNEFDEKIIKPEWFQAIKGIYDGEGRQRGVAGSRNRTEIMKIHSSIVLIGQYVVTMDDNSIVTRSIIEGFHERDLTEEDKINYQELKDLEEGGISSLVTEVLKYREEFKARYKDRFNEVLMDWRLTMTDRGQNFNQRIMQNWCHVYTSYDVMSKYVRLPVSIAKFEAYCKDRSLHWSGFIRTSDTLSEFWNTFTFLIDQGILEEGWDFKIETRVDLKVRLGREDEKQIVFPEATKILFIRMNNVHKHYQEAYRKRTGKEGMTLENLDHYMSSRNYFVGPVKSSPFKRFVTKIETQTHQLPGGGMSSGQPTPIRQSEQIKTSSVAFNYDLLGLDIERTNPDLEEATHQFSANGGGYRPISNDIPFS